MFMKRFSHKNNDVFKGIQLIDALNNEPQQLVTISLPFH
jgi:hypothetical protein